MMKKTKIAANDEPDWVNPVNDRKRPFTAKEIDIFVEDLILGLDPREWAEVKSEYGEQEARRRISAEMIKMDENNLDNITPKGPVN